MDDGCFQDAFAHAASDADLLLAGEDGEVGLVLRGGIPVLQGEVDHLRDLVGAVERREHHGGDEVPGLRGEVRVGADGGEEGGSEDLGNHF